MATKTVPVHPATLKWARVEVGLSVQQSAEKLKVTVEQINNWEAGETGIGLSNARKLAEKYKISLPTLYLQTIPEQWREERLEDFRKSESKNPYSYQLCCAIRDARTRQLWMHEYLQSENAQSLDWLGYFSDNKNVKHIAKWLFDWLEINREDITKLKNDKDALSYWIDKIESKRIIVSSNKTHSAYKIEHSEYSGLVLYDNYAPLILLNPADSPARRIFTLVHELAHLLLDDKSGVSKIDFRQDPAGYGPIEVLCNRVASQVFIDDDYLKDRWNDGDNLKETIQRLALDLKISHSAIAVKLKLLGLIDPETLDGLLYKYQQRFLEAQGNNPSGGRAVPDKQVLDRCGKFLTQSVLAAYEQGSVNATEIYDVLGLKLKYLSKLSNRLKFPLHRWVS